MLCCDDCRNGRYMTVMCQAECGHGAARGGMKLCQDCAKAKNACEACGAALAPPAAGKDEDPPPHTD